jgi:hypothetical protein
VLWFGEPWPRPDFRAPVCEDDRLRVPIPVGQGCLFCHEPMTEVSQGVWIGYLTNRSASQSKPSHVRCLLLNTVGQKVTDVVMQRGPIDNEPH